MYLPAVVLYKRKKKRKPCFPSVKLSQLFIHDDVSAAHPAILQKHLAADQKLPWKEMLLAQEVCSTVITVLHFVCDSGVCNAALLACICYSEFSVLINWGVNDKQMLD